MLNSFLVIMIINKKEQYQTVEEMHMKLLVPFIYSLEKRGYVFKLRKDYARKRTTHKI